MASNSMVCNLKLCSSFPKILWFRGLLYRIYSLWGMWFLWQLRLCKRQQHEAFDGLCLCPWRIMLSCQYTVATHQLTNINSNSSFLYVPPACSVSFGNVSWYGGQILLQTLFHLDFFWLLILLLLFLFIFYRDSTQLKVISPALACG